MLARVLEIILSLRISNLVIGAIAVLIATYLYSTWNHNIFKNVVGCPGPSPWPLLGTLPLYFKHGLHADLELKNKYGRTFGVFDGVNPVLVTSDLDLIKQIAIKDFDCFVNHNRVCINYPLNLTLGSSRDEHWRQLRTTASHAITGAKLKRIFNTVHECAQELTNNLERFAKTEEMCEIGKLLGNFALDVSTRTQFALEVHSYREPNHPFAVHAAKMFSSLKVLQPAMMIYMFFPRLLKLIDRWNIHYFKIYPADSVSFFKAIAMNVIKYRVNSSEKRSDIIQLLLDTRNHNPNDHQEVPNDDQLDETEKFSHQISRGVKMRGLSDIEICGIALSFMLAGYESTSCATGWALHALSLHQDVQEKLYREVQRCCADGQQMNYNVLMNMQYLDQVVNETIRKYSIAIRADRVCNKACQLGPYAVPKGMVVHMSIIGVHNDEEYWPEPTKFVPERFAAENRHKIHPNSILTFDIGPRICLGRRFALLQIKTILACLVSKYLILPCANTPIEPVTYAKSQFVVPADGFWVSFKRRSL